MDNMLSSELLIFTAQESRDERKTIILFAALWANE